MYVLHSFSNCTAVPTPSVPMCDDCDNAWLNLLMYMFVNVIYNVFILLVIKHGSATILSIAQTIRLPLTNLCFSLHFIMGKAAVPFSGYSLYGLITILAGLTAYRVASLRKAAAAKAAGGEEQKPRIIPHLGPGGMEVVLETVHKPVILPKTNAKLREQYFTRLGINNPASPSPPPSPSPSAPPPSYPVYSPTTSIQ